MAKRRKRKAGLFHRLKRLLGFVLILALAWFLLGFVPRENNFTLENPMRSVELPMLIAHGGGNREFPDNTLEAFYNAYSVDPNVMMETDVSITKDGVVILSHDTTLDRKTDVTGAIADWTYEELMHQQVDFGFTNPVKNGQLNGKRVRFTTDSGRTVSPRDVSYPAGVIPRHRTKFLCTTLEDLLIAFPENPINVEIKQEGELGKAALAEVIRLLRLYDAFDRVVLASFHDEIYEAFVALKTSGQVPESFMFSPSVKPMIGYVALGAANLDFLFKDGLCVFQLPTEKMGIPLDTQWLVDSAHKHNVAVHYWTVNDVSEMQHLIDIGADGIMTDYPHLLKQVLDAQGEDGPTAVIAN
ncbi:MAG: glycerophosphodiester phosphodiesterase [Clostridia bacterium]|nr:glycerophosphodiester phosphodiesterase [Clostridia bacterium]